MSRLGSRGLAPVLALLCVGAACVIVAGARVVRG